MGSRVASALEWTTFTPLVTSENPNPTSATKLRANAG